MRGMGERRPLPAAVAVAVAIALAGCGGDDEDTTVTVEGTTTVTETAPTTDTTAVPELPPTGEAPAEGCRDGSGNEIEIVTGDVDCAAAQQAAAGYDLQGERVQEVGEWVCEGGNAQTRPVIFTCTGPGGEFVVREAGG
jgi:hypothetical protein